MNRNRIKNYLIVFFGFALFNILAWLIVELETKDANASITSFWDAWWYFIITLTTVGYGDFFPVTVGGRIIGLFMAIMSLGFLGFILSSVTKKIIDYMKKQEQGYYGTKFKDHFVIFGWDDFGRQVADLIIKNDNQLAIVTNSPNVVEHIKKIYDKNVFVLYADYNNISVLDKVNIKDASSVFVNFEDDTKTLVHLINIRKKHPNLNYVVSLDNPNLKETFTNIGSTFIVSKSDIAAKLVASSIFEPDVASFAEDLISYSDKDTESDIQEYKITSSSPYLDKNYMDVFVDIKQKYNSVLIGLAKYSDGNMKIFKNPKENLNIGKNDFIIIISDGGVKPVLEKALGVKEGRSSHEFD